MKKNLQILERIFTANSPTPRPFLALPSRAGTLFLPCRQGRNIKSEHFSEHTFLIFFQNMLQSEQKYSTKSKFLVNKKWTIEVGSCPLGFFLQNWHTAGDCETCKKRQINYFFFFSKTAARIKLKKMRLFQKLSRSLFMSKMKNILHFLHKWTIFSLFFPDKWKTWILTKWFCSV